MKGNLTELSNIAELERVLADSNTRAQLIFKHSNACPISSRAFDELQAHLTNLDEREVDYSLIVVQHARDVSNAVAAQLNVEHESPQAILVRDKKPVWHASHGRITAATLAQAISQGGQTGQAG